MLGFLQQQFYKLHLTLTQHLALSRDAQCFAEAPPCLRGIRNGIFDLLKYQICTRLKTWQMLTNITKQWVQVFLYTWSWESQIWYLVFWKEAIVLTLNRYQLTVRFAATSVTRLLQLWWVLHPWVHTTVTKTGMPIQWLFLTVYRCELFT